MKRAVILVFAVLLAGCAKLPAPQPGPPVPAEVTERSSLIPDGYQGRFRLRATVLADASHGPQLCSGVLFSSPIQCSGPDITNWKWEGLESVEQQGTRHGTYIVTGTWDGKAFTLTEQALEDDGSWATQPPGGPDFKSPCAEPPGGWKPVDQAKATSDAMNATTALVSKDPDFAGLWIDETIPPSDTATPANDPRRLILNVRFVKDLQRHEAEIRAVWGGALCVSLGKYTHADLLGIQTELQGDPGVVSAGTDVTAGRVEIEMWAAYAGRQREFEAKYGAGVVVLRGRLYPID